MPQPGDVLYVGLDRAVPRCAVALRVDCEIEGLGIDPTDPPLVWEAWTGDGWAPCDVEDETGGFNRAGDVVLHVPDARTRCGARGRSGRLAALPRRRPGEDQPRTALAPDPRR